MPSRPTPTANDPVRNDPVSQAILNARFCAGRIPVPLVSTSYDIHISGGLADVVARRTFRNTEARSIEAVLTFPLPVHAVLYALDARIGGRTLRAVAKARAAARESYEDAIDRGKTAVLHEEVLKGVHMLSVAHVAPGTEIEVTVRFALALASIGGGALLRIPTTVGDIYGASGLPDSDDLVSGGDDTFADLSVACDSGTLHLKGGTLQAGKARVSLSSPIAVEVHNWTARSLVGRAADGRIVTLSLGPAAHATAALDAAVLVDHSGSMASLCALEARLTKHEAVLLGLSEAAADLTGGDRLNLWEFDDGATDLGTFTASSWRDGLRLLSGPRGGTEIGRSIDALLTQRPVRDVLVITDGKSHALDVQRLAARGVRFTVLLIGDDSLEANVGHLAALTGGEIFVPSGGNVTAAVKSALQSLRSPCLTPQAGRDQSGDRVCAVRSGMEITATWQARDAARDEPALSRAAAAYAAGLKLTQLPEVQAAALAEAEGLVTHLTSLVLVDEESTTEQGLPALRKVALPMPATARVCAAPPSYQVDATTVMFALSRAPAAMDEGGVLREERSFAIRRPAAVAGGAMRSCAKTVAKVFDREQAGARKSSQRERKEDWNDAVPDRAGILNQLASLIGTIDWKTEGARLSDGHVVGLSTGAADIIDEAARLRLIVKAARRFGLSPRALIIGLLARADAIHDRYADRVARAILGKAKRSDVHRLAMAMGLSGKSHAA